MFKVADGTKKMIFKAEAVRRQKKPNNLLKIGKPNERESDTER